MDSVSIQKIEKSDDSPETHKKIESLVRELLSLEKDWSVPGHEVLEATRVDRIIDIIEKVDI